MHSSGYSDRIPRVNEAAVAAFPNTRKPLSRKEGLKLLAAASPSGIEGMPAKPMNSSKIRCTTTGGAGSGVVLAAKR